MRDLRFRVLFGGCLTQFTVSGVFFSYGLFFAALENDFGWSREFFSSAVAVSILMMGLLAILIGRLNDKFGPRIVLGLCGVAYGTGFALLSQVSAQWQMLAVFAIFISFGLAVNDVVTLSTISGWFERRRGLMSGIVKTGTALGQVAVPPMAAYLLVTLGWRSAFMTLGVLAIAFLIVAALSMSQPPKREGPDRDKQLPWVSFAEARKLRAFWMLCTIQFMFFPSMIAVPTHLAVHGMDLGMTLAKAAALLSVLGATSVAGRLTVGVLADRTGSKRALVLCLAVLFGSLTAFVNVTSSAPLFFVVACYGFGHGGLFTIISPLVAEYFGMHSHGSIFGTILFFGTIGGAVGPIFAGMVFDVHGSYHYAFTVLAIMALIALVLACTLPVKEQVAAEGT